MKERIKEFIDYKGIQAGELASLLEVQRSNISHILNGRNKPGASLIEKMLLVFPELNARWLLTGDGNMIESAVKEELSTGIYEKVIPSSENASNKSVKTDKQQINKVILLYNDGSFTAYDK